MAANRRRLATSWRFFESSSLEKTDTPLRVISLATLTRALIHPIHLPQRRLNSRSYNFTYRHLSTYPESSRTFLHHNRCLFSAPFGFLPNAPFQGGPCPLSTEEIESMTSNLHSVPVLFEKYGAPYPHVAELDRPLLEGKWSASA
jgi:hypothetical protein